MSGALSNITKDERRSHLLTMYLEALKKYLSSPNKTNRAKVIKAAKNTNAIGHGYMSAPTKLIQNIDERLEKLSEGDKKEWAKVLTAAQGQYYLERRPGKDDRVIYLFPELKAMSPFKDRMIIFADYGRGFVNFYGELADLVKQIISDENGMKTYDADEYLIALPKINPKDAEAVWMNCGIAGVDGPRKKNGKIKKTKKK